LTCLSAIRSFLGRSFQVIRNTQIVRYRARFVRGILLWSPSMESQEQSQFQGRGRKAGDIVRAVTLAVNVGLLTFTAVHLMVSSQLMVSFI
jgi:hypothetical protein